MARDIIQEARECYADCKDAVAEQYERIREDFRFSNPSDPQQWDDVARTMRKGRPTHTLDRTNQYVQHVVNKNRERKTSAEVLAVDSKSDPKTADKIRGLFRHIEYTSRADIAWDTAADHQARGGLGWVRITPKVVNGDLNEQEITIQRVIDPTSCYLDANSTEPDGSDAMYGFCETQLTKRAFERSYPKAKLSSFDSDGWFGIDSVKICEYFKVVETQKNLIQAVIAGQLVELTEAEYWETAERTGVKPVFIGNTMVSERKVAWYKMSGLEVLEETEYPSRWIGLIPVLGHETWIDGKRYLCGLVRRLMDGQRLHNYEMSAFTEALMTQPKAPFLVPGRAINGYEEEWQRLNSGNPAYLTFNDLDDSGQPISPPIRLSPPQFPMGFANAAGLAAQEMEVAVGMPRPVLGAQSNAISGRAKIADKEAGETATFHFSDGLRVAKEHAYRVMLDMMPRVYSGRRMAMILGEDEKQSSVTLDDEQESAYEKAGDRVSINLNVGKYDVRVKVGPSYTTIREELGVKLQELGKGNPVLAAALMPIIMKMSDMPEADKISRVAIAMLPPQVQEAYKETGQDDLSPEAKAQIMEQGQQIEQMAKAMEQAAKVIQDLQSQLDEKQADAAAETKAGIAEIKLAQEKLAAQAKELAAKERELADAQRIAILELQLAEAQAAARQSQREEAGEAE